MTDYRFLLRKAMNQTPMLKWNKSFLENGKKTCIKYSYFQMQKLPIFMLIPLPYVVMLHVYVNLKYST